MTCVPTLPDSAAFFTHMAVDHEALADQAARVYHIMLPDLTGQQSREAVDIGLSIDEAQRLLDADTWPAATTVSGLRALRRRA